MHLLLVVFTDRPQSRSQMAIVCQDIGGLHPRWLCRLSASFLHPVPPVQELLADCPFTEPQVRPSTRFTWTIC